MQIMQFVNGNQLSSALFERPYFVVPKDSVEAKALSIMRKALSQTGKLGIGKIAFSGREHLVAIGAPVDPKQQGLMLYTLRFAEELRDPKSVLSGLKETTVDASELSLAKQLINGRTSSFELAAYKNDYTAAVKKLIDAKRKGRVFLETEPKSLTPKVVNIMDALRGSLAEEKKPRKVVGRRTGRRKRAA
jgi:DNA end-binding protein Ku